VKIKDLRIRGLEDFRIERWKNGKFERVRKEDGIR